MRSLIAFFAVVAAICSCSCSASAATIDSTASGVYIAPDRACRLVLSRLGTSHIRVDLLCITDAGVPMSSVTAALSGSGCIGSPGVATTYRFSGLTTAAGYVTIDRFDAVGLHVRVAAGPDDFGVPQTWQLARPLASPVPFACAASTAKPRGR